MKKKKSEQGGDDYAIPSSKFQTVQKNMVEYKTILQRYKTTDNVKKSISKFYELKSKFYVLKSKFLVLDK